MKTLLILAALASLLACSPRSQTSKLWIKGNAGAPNLGTTALAWKCDDPQYLEALVSIAFRRAYCRDNSGKLNVMDSAYSMPVTKTVIQNNDGTSTRVFYQANILIGTYTK